MIVSEVMTSSHLTYMQRINTTFANDERSPEISEVSHEGNIHLLQQTTTGKQFVPLNILQECCMQDSRILHPYSHGKWRNGRTIIQYRPRYCGALTPPLLRSCRLDRETKLLACKTASAPPLDSCSRTKLEKDLITYGYIAAYCFTVSP
jgi:hypothetical protein